MRASSAALFIILLSQSLSMADTPPHTKIKNTLHKNKHILFHEDFERDKQEWSFLSLNNLFLSLETHSSLAHSGHGFLRSKVTKNNLKLLHNLSSDTRYILKQPVDDIYWRFYTRFNAGSPTPHHWVKLAATNGEFDVRGKAGVKPSGDEAVWFDIDIDKNDLFSFYVYWHEMHSGRCNNGTAIKGCDGDQGHSYYYGNIFKPANQIPMPRNEWFCIEIHAKLNDVGQNNGELSMWINDKAVGTYKKGIPTGTWLRGQFHSNGCDFFACTKPEPFSGFNFRTSDKVQFRELHMDAYYQLNTFNKKSNYLKTSGADVVDTQIIDYDDIVVASTRIGCGF